MFRRALNVEQLAVFEAHRGVNKPEEDPLTCELFVGDFVRLVDQTSGWGQYSKGDEVYIQLVREMGGFYAGPRGGGGGWAGARKCFYLLARGGDVPVYKEEVKDPLVEQSIYPVGSSVKIAEGTRFYDDGDEVMNPTNTVGEVVKSGARGKEYGIHVKWGEVTNSYSESDLTGA